MSENNGTGVAYPEIELGGKTYQIKFTRGALYRLDKQGLVFNPKFTMGPDGKVTGASMSFSSMVDALGIVISFDGTAEELAELCYDARDNITVLLIEAWGKVVLPSLNARIAALTAAKAAASEAKPN